MSLTSDEIVDPADQAGPRKRTFADVEAELACRDLMTSFCAAVDAGRADEAASVFTEDCSADIGDQTKQGRAAVREVLAARPAGTGRRTLHLLCNPVIRTTGENSAAGTSVIVAFVLVDADGTLDRTPRRISAVSDQFTRGADGRWLIAERRTATLASPASPATEIN
jgi:ketosteroid isomerase-like protein